jgi:hypothetical protein
MRARACVQGLYLYIYELREESGHVWNTKLYIIEQHTSLCGSLILKCYGILAGIAHSV